MPFDRFADRAKRRPRRLKKQKAYSEAHRQRLTDARCPDRDEVASAAIKVIIDFMAHDTHSIGERFISALVRELVARDFCQEQSLNKLKAMVLKRRGKIAAKMAQ